MLTLAFEFDRQPAGGDLVGKPPDGPAARWCTGTMTEDRLAGLDRPLRNRVTPAGELIATEHRGTMYGNRGMVQKREPGLGPALPGPPLAGMRAGVPPPSAAHHTARLL